ncbi:MAG: hypothetical protein IPO28_14970 [Holophagaceae bacterium]|nr:hypothetical protein [Holophagaceae bacterium]
MLEVALAGPQAFTGRPVAAREWAKAETQLKEPWDRALLIVLKAELGEAPPPAPSLDEAGVTRLGPAGEHFRRAHLAAYAGGPMPPPESASTSIAVWGMATPPTCLRRACWTARAEERPSGPKPEGP